MRTRRRQQQRLRVRQSRGGTAQNVLLAVVMLLGRFVPILLVLALAGALAAAAPPLTRGHPALRTPSLTTLLVSVAPIVALVAYLPVLALGPLGEACHGTTRAHARAVPTAMKSLNPARLWKSPVMLVVWVGAAVTTLAAAIHPGWFSIGVAGWLWATVVFGALSEAVAEGRGKARAASMRRNRIDLVARRSGDGEETVSAAELRQGDRAGRGARDHPVRRRDRRGRGHRG